MKNENIQQLINQFEDRIKNLEENSKDLEDAYSGAPDEEDIVIEWETINDTIDECRIEMNLLKELKAYRAAYEELKAVHDSTGYYNYVCDIIKKHLETEGIKK